MPWISQTTIRWDRMATRLRRALTYDSPDGGAHLPLGLLLNAQHVWALSQEKCGQSTQVSTSRMANEEHALLTGSRVEQVEDKGGVCALHVIPPQTLENCSEIKPFSLTVSMFHFCPFSFNHSRHSAISWTIWQTFPCIQTQHTYSQGQRNPGDRGGCSPNIYIGFVCFSKKKKKLYIYIMTFVPPNPNIRLCPTLLSTLHTHCSRPESSYGLYVKFLPFYDLNGDTPWEKWNNPGRSLLRWAPWPSAGTAGNRWPFPLSPRPLHIQTQRRGCQQPLIGPF